MANIVRLDKVAATVNPTKIKSVKIDTDLANGVVLALDGLETGEREVYKTKTPTATTTDYVILATPEVVYDNRFGKTDIQKFVNDKDKPARGIVLCKDDIISLSVDCLEGDPTTNKVVELQAGNKLKVVETATPKSTVVGKVSAIETVSGVQFAVIEVK